MLIRGKYKSNCRQQKKTESIVNAHLHSQQAHKSYLKISSARPNRITQT